MKDCVYLRWGLACCIIPQLHHFYHGMRRTRRVGVGGTHRGGRTCYGAKSPYSRKVFLLTRFSSFKLPTKKTAFNDNKILPGKKDLLAVLSCDFFSLQNSIIIKCQTLLRRSASNENLCLGLLLLVECLED